MTRVAFFLALLLYAPFVMAEDRLCPDIETLRTQTPDTMTGVQADIDRMKLCVERAKLLRQLDDIAKQRQDILKKVTKQDSGASMPAMLVPIPSLSASALPTLERAAEAEQIVPVQSQPSWSVRKIWGQGGEMRAQLSDGTGVLLNVAQGDVLPDGALVEKLSVKGVTLSTGGKSRDLTWEQQEATKK